MVPYAVAEGFVSQRHLQLLEEAIAFVASLPDGLDCHAVAKAVAEKFSLAYYRGYFYSKGWPHSWCVDEDERVLLDPYPWAGTQPILVSLDGMSPWQFLYKEHSDESGGSRSDERPDSPDGAVREREDVVFSARFSG